MTQSQSQGTASATLLSRLDRALQKQYHQSLAEVLAELRLRNILTEIEPAPDRIVSLLLHAHVLRPVESPPVWQDRTALERFLSGGSGRCTNCGMTLTDAAPGNKPGPTLCPECRELRTLPSA